MDRTIDGLEGVFAYMDDSRVSSPDRQTHLLHLEVVFNALATKGLTINLEKGIFAVPSLEILSHMISAIGLTPQGWSRCQNRTPSSGQQATAKFSWHGKLLLPFFAKLCTGIAPFSLSLKGGA